MRIFLTLLLTSFLAAPLAARDLHWKAFDVQARLDNDGRLHVVERQHFVFSGDWNGGERTFDIRRGQELDLVRISRIDEGAVIDLKRGSLDKVDHYGWGENRSLRWRSRRPQDPPFMNTEIVYEIEYVLSNFLLTREREGRMIYVIDHDFAFAERQGRIENYSLRLSFDDAWTPLSPVRSEYQVSRLEPGESFPLDVDLAYQGAGMPAGVTQNAPLLVRRGVLLATASAIGLILMSFFAFERSRHRFEHEEVPSITPEWLEKNVFFAPPEVIGALWDVNTGAAEVAAMMARLAQEKKIETKVLQGGWFGGPTLEMKVLVPRARFSESERPLIDAFFIDGDTTSTEKIKAHYRSSGFDPSGVIKDALAAAIGANPAWAEQKVPRNWWRDILLVLAAFVLLAIACLQGDDDRVAAITIGVSGIATMLIASAIAYSSRNASGSLGGWAIAFTLPTSIQLAALASFSFSDEFRLSSFTYVVLGTAIAIFYWFVIGFAPFTESLKRLAVRRRLKAARHFFEGELRKPEPALRDEWFPYIMAFGLGHNVDRWFSSFGGASTAGTFTGPSSGGSASASSSSGGPSGSWSGGMSSFGGGGATGAWAAAAGGLAAGVSAPSSSGGGGGGGGSSSGGGGGGGW